MFAAADYVGWCCSTIDDETSAYESDEYVGDGGADGDADVVLLPLNVVDHLMAVLTYGSIDDRESWLSYSMSNQHLKNKKSFIGDLQNLTLCVCTSAPHCRNYIFIYRFRHSQQ